jgi:hypothetical protein
MFDSKKGAYPSMSIGSNKYALSSPVNNFSTTTTLAMFDRAAVKKMLGNAHAKAGKQDLCHDNGFYALR